MSDPMSGPALKLCPQCGRPPDDQTPTWKWGAAPAVCCRTGGCRLFGILFSPGEWAHRPVEDALRAERDAALARADLAEARLAKVIQYLHDEAREAHDIFMQSDPRNLKLYHQVEALEMCLEEARRISKEEKPNRAVLIVKDVE
jgi:hypothetical protein